MDICSLSPSCQLDLVFDIVFLLREELLLNTSILIGLLLTRDGFNLLVTSSDTTNYCSRVSRKTRRMMSPTIGISRMLKVVALYLMILDNIRFSSGFDLAPRFGILKIAWFLRPFMAIAFIS